jgi:hypothetical protein
MVTEGAMEHRSCARCGDPLRVNTRSGDAHRYCAAVECQRERRRLAQRDRRSRALEPSVATKAAQAAYMRTYRDDHPDYRASEREAACERRRRNEAGSSDQPARVYLVLGRGSVVEVRVVSDDGLAVTMSAAEASGSTRSRRNEAG